jgi:hypothetical protein
MCDMKYNVFLWLTLQTLNFMTVNIKREDHKCFCALKKSSLHQNVASVTS